MLPFSLFLVLGSALLHAFWNALLKRAQDRESASAGILTVALALTAGAVPFLPGPVFPDRPALLWGLAAGVWEAGYFLALVGALERAPLGWSYTWMRGGAVLLVWPLSVLLLGEPMGPFSALCVAAVCLGLLFMGLVANPGQGAGALLWAAAAGLCIAGFTLCYKVALGHGAHPVALFATSMAVSLPIQLAVRSRRRGLRAALTLPGQPVLVLVAGALCTLSFLMYLQALAFEGAGAVATLRNSSVVFALVFSWALGENPSPRQWLGAALVAAGAAGLAWH